MDDVIKPETEETWQKVSRDLSLTYLIHIHYLILVVFPRQVDDLSDADLS
jgi:hypothetical protein